MKFPVATKIIKDQKDNTTATLTREGARVFCMKYGATLYDRTFTSTSEAKRFMGLTTAV